MKVIISDNAAYTAVRIAPDNVIGLNMTNAKLSNNVEEIRHINAQMESYVLLTIKNHFNEVKKFIETKASAHW